MDALYAKLAVEMTGRSVATDSGIYPVNPYNPSPYRRTTIERKHSKIGIASLVAGVSAGILTIALLLFTGYIALSNPEGIEEDSPILFVIGFFGLVFPLVALVGLGLGIAGLYERDRKKTLPLFGIVSCAIVLFGTLWMFWSAFTTE
jgi:hypothetical protein